MPHYKVTALFDTGQYLSEDRQTSTNPNNAYHILERVAITVEDMLIRKPIEANVAKLTIEFWP